MTQSTFLYQGYTKAIRFLLVMFLTLTASAEVWAEEATLSFANKAQRTSFSNTQQVWEQNDVTFTNNKSSSTTNVADYANPVRLYANSQIIVAHSSGKIKSIVFDCNSSSYATALKNSIGTISEATVTVSSDKVTVTFTKAVASFTVSKLTAQVRVDSITITYEGSSVKTYTISPKLSHVTASGGNATTITSENTELMLEYFAESGWKLPATISVTMGGTPLSSKIDYDWDSNEGSLYITLTNGFTGDIMVTINGWQQLAAPTGLNVSNSSSTAAALSWGAVTNAKSYTIQVLGENDEVIDSYEGITNTTYTVTDLDICDEYLFGVIAIGDGVTYYNSAQKIFEVFTIPLGTPNVTVSGVTATSFTLSWDAVEGATGYNVYNYEADIAEELLATTNEYTFTELDANTSYEWTVEAVITQGNTQKCSSEQSNWTTTLSGDCEQLGKATNLEVDACYTNPEDGQTYVRFSWTPATSSKENTSQKICFGLVGQDATCKEREYNITWAGDLASKLPAGEYEWSIQAIGDGVDYCDGDAISGPNFTIYSITYNTNGGAEIAATSGTTLPNSLPTTTREHYTFVGWYTNSECTQAAIAGAKITQNTTLYAKWEAETFQITLNPNEGTLKDKSGNVQSTIVFDYEYDSQSSPLSNYYSTITRDGYEFVGWFTEQSGGEKWTETGSATQKITLYAQWVKLYIVTLVPGSGSVTSTTLTESSAGAGVTLPTPTLDCGDWEFVGWAEASVEETTTEPTLFKAGDNYKPISDCKLYAVYSKSETTEGTPITTNQTYTYTITAKTWSANGAQTLNSISWTLDNNGSYYGYDGTKGQQVGSSGYPAKSMTLTTNGFSSATKITAVRISTSGASSISGNVSVKVGSTSYTSDGNNTKSLTSTNTQYEFTGSSTGNVTISWSQTSSKAIYFKEMEVDYQTTAGGTITTTHYNSNPVCQTCENVLTISKGTESNGTFTLSKSGKIKTCDGVVDVVVTPIPAEHYHIGSVTATTPTTGGAPTMTDNGDGTWTVNYFRDSKGESTINVTFDEDAKATVILSELGETTTYNSTYYVGEQYTLPATTEQSCEGKKLVGWSNVEVVETDTKPTENYYELGATVTLEAEQTFYAVFAAGRGGNGGETTVNLSIKDYAVANSWVNATQYTTVNIDENVTVTAEGGGNTGKYYTTGTNWRLYQLETPSLTFAAEDGYTIKQITITYTVDNTGILTFAGSNITSGDPCAINATSATFGVGNTGSATNGQVRISNISVTYSGSGGGYTDYSTSCGTFTITYYGFNSGGCTTTCGNNPAEREVAQGATYTIPDCKPTFDPAGLGRTFAGTWNTQANGKGTEYEPGDEFIVNSDITLYAQWALNTSGNTTLPTDVEDLATTDIVVTGGTILTLKAGTTTINSLTLKGGWQADSTYAMPVVNIPEGATLVRNNNKINLDLKVNNNSYYPFAVPFEVANTSENVNYLDTTLKKYANANYGYGKFYEILEYNGALRAENGVNSKENWVHVGRHTPQKPSYLVPGKGYAISAVPASGQDTVTIRITMTVDNAWLVNGEQDSITVKGQTTTRDTVPVTAYTGAAATEHPRHAGWNFVANPYLSNFAGSEASNEDGSFITGELLINKGEYYYDRDDDVPYVTIPTYNFEHYYQVKLSEATLSPAYSFFVQVGTDGTMTFDVAGRQAAPASIAARNAEERPVKMDVDITLSDNHSSDQTGIIISDRYSEAYEIGRDLEKLFGSAYNLSVYTLMADNTPLAFQALAIRSNMQVIPVGYRAPEQGEYTFRLNEATSSIDLLNEQYEQLVLVDYQTGELTNLLIADYTFYSERTQADNRFAIYAVPRQNAPTDLPNAIGQDKQAQKIIHNGHLYILRDGNVYNGNGQIVK